MSSPTTVRVEYLGQGQLRICGPSTAPLELHETPRRQLGQALLDALDGGSLERSPAPQEVSREASLTLGERGIIEIEAPDGPFLDLSIDKSREAPELLGAIVLEALAVHPELTMHENLVYLELDGRAVALLTEPEWVDMFWTSYRVVPFEPLPELTEEFWRRDERLKYRNASSLRVGYSFGVQWDPETSRVVLRSPPV